MFRFSVHNDWIVSIVIVSIMGGVESIMGDVDQRSKFGLVKLLWPNDCYQCTNHQINAQTWVHQFIIWRTQFNSRKETKLSTLLIAVNWMLVNFQEYSLFFLSVFTLDAIIWTDNHGILAFKIDVAFMLSGNAKRKKRQ